MLFDHWLKWYPRVYCFCILAESRHRLLLPCYIVLQWWGLSQIIFGSNELVMFPYSSTVLYITSRVLLFTYFKVFYGVLFLGNNANLLFGVVRQC